MNPATESDSGCSDEETDMRENTQNHLSIQNFTTETSTRPNVVFLEQSENVYKCTERKSSVTLTTIVTVEKESIESEVRRYRDKNRDKYYDGTSKSSDDDHKSAEYEASESMRGRKCDSDAETTSSELTYAVKDKRNRFEGDSPRSRYNSRRTSPRYESCHRSQRSRSGSPRRCSSRNHSSRSRSPRGRSPRRHSPKRRSNKRRSPRRRSPRRRSPRRRSSRRLSPRRRSPRRRSPRRRSPRRRSPRRRSPKRRSPRYESRRSRSPSYDDRRSRSVSRFRNENGETDRKTDGNRNEHNTRDSYSDSWDEQDTNTAVADTTQPQSDTNDFLASLLRTKILSVISNATDEILGENSAEPTLSNDEHTLQKCTDVKSELSTLITSEFNDQRTSTVTSNEQNHLTNDVAGIINEETSINFNDRIDDEIIDQTTNITDNEVGQVTFDDYAFKQDLTYFKTEENADFTYNTEAQTEENSLSDVQYFPGYKHIPKPVPEPAPKASIVPVSMLSTPPPFVPNQLTIFQPHTLSTLQPGLMSPHLLSNPELMQHLNWNPYMQQQQLYHHSGMLRDPRLSRLSNPFNSSPRAHSQPFPYPVHNQIANNTCPMASYQINKAPMTYGEYKRQNASVPSNSIPRMTPSKSYFAVKRTVNKSVSIPKENFKIPKIPRGRVPSNTIKIIDDWDVTPESVKKQLNVGGNAEPERKVNVKSEDDMEPKVRNHNGTNQPTQQGNDVATDTLSVDSPFTEVNAETVLKGVENPNNLLALIDIMRKLSENNTLAKVREILQNCADGESVTNQELSENVVANVQNIDVTKTTKKRHKNELDRLNEDIDNMFIRDAVLSANGRRSKSVAKYVETTSDDYTYNGKPKPASTSKMSDIDIIPNEYVAEPAKIQASTSTALETRKPTKKVSKLVKKPAKTVKKETAKSIKKLIIPSELNYSSVEGKRSRDIMEGVVESMEPTSKKAKETSAAKMPLVKNNSKEWHSLKKIFGCQLCDKPCGLSVVNHYVNSHPNNEVFISRLAPEAVECLFNPTFINKCEVIKRPGQHGANPHYEFKQFCYFCNVYKCMAKSSWISHIAVHTGYYQFKCVDCNKKFANKPFNHRVKENHQVEKILQPYFQKKVLKAYICDVCNFVRFTKSEIETHLCNQHEGDDNITFKEVDFLNFTKKRKQERDKCDFESYESNYLEEGDTELQKLYKKSIKEESEEECENDEEIEGDWETLKGEEEEND